MKMLLVVALFASNAIACGKGCFEYEGNCACDQQAYTAPSVEPSAGLPRKEQVREWESGEVKADMPKSLMDSDIARDKEIADADREGKLAAGIPIGKEPTR